MRWCLALPAARTVSRPSRSISARRAIRDAGIGLSGNRPAIRARLARKLFCWIVPACSLRNVSMAGQPRWAAQRLTRSTYSSGIGLVAHCGSRGSLAPSTVATSRMARLARPRGTGSPEFAPAAALASCSIAASSLLSAAVPAHSARIVQLGGEDRRSQQWPPPRDHRRRWRRAPADGTDCSAMWRGRAGRRRGWPGPGPGSAGRLR